MLSITNVLLFVGLVLVAVAVGLFVALVMWYLATFITREMFEFVDTYKGERRKCKVESTDYLFTEWVEEFHKEPLNMMREYADAK